IDTVLLAIADMQGRLQGKRLSARYFLDEVLNHGSEGCNYLLAVDVDMNTVSGYAMSSWERGYGDFVMKPDLQTLRRVPWQEGTAMLMADLAWENGADVTASPRQILRRQLARLAERGLVAFVGTELEFIVFEDSYEEAWKRAYRDLSPANLYNVDYSLLGTARIEPLLRRIRLGMEGAGLYVESAKGECNLGQHEIAFRYDEALRTCDHHSIYKNGAKEMAAQEGKSITFMAKPNQREGNSCHIHISLRSGGGDAVMAGEGPYGMSELGARFIAGQLACLRELTLMYAPNINSYKRYVPGSFAPTAVKWGVDNRTCALRLVGHGHSLRVENRVPGGDVNPYLAVAALIAAGLHGIDNELPLEEAYAGNAYASGAETVPHTLRDALALFEGSKLARETFGEDVVEHYANNARVELAAFDA
ncbi:glutamine synthetase family protein, partial [Nonomuraea basaltis]|uniref:glutamine synthetase family protein n=1 Tax=Nonomuraea basaltis TaxID=2495887 RepID=UPI00110C4744